MKPMLVMVRMVMYPKVFGAAYLHLARPDAYSTTPKPNTSHSVKGGRETHLASDDPVGGYVSIGKIPKIKDVSSDFIPTRCGSVQ